MYYIYILKSIEREWYYTGHSENVEKRVLQHNEGRNKSTKAYRPFQLIYMNVLLQEEKHLKS
jgi:putative endonuclease